MEGEKKTRTVISFHIFEWINIKYINADIDIV